jgi:hypothetical protein
VTKPGGTIAIVTWGEPEGMEAAALLKSTAHLMPPPPPGAPGPFALSNESALRNFAEQAGLTAKDIFDVDCPFEFPDLETALIALSSSGVTVRAAQHSGPEAVAEALSNALAPYRRSDGSYRALAVFRCLLAS